MTHHDLKRAGWVRLSAPGDKLGACWHHPSSGWLIKHCGHPTANFPYEVFAPDGRRHLAPNGRCFMSLVAAAAGAAEASRASEPTALTCQVVVATHQGTEVLSELTLPTAPPRRAA